MNGTALDEPYTFLDAAGMREPTTAGQARWVVSGGQLFVMGAHRRRPLDSRAFGPIPVSSVIGRGGLRYWPLASIGIVHKPPYPGVPNS